MVSFFPFNLKNKNVSRNDSILSFLILLSIPPGPDRGRHRQGDRDLSVPPSSFFLKRQVPVPLSDPCLRDSYFFNC